MGINVAQFVRQWSLRDGARTALVLPARDASQPAQVMSYAELDQRASQVAASLRQAGFEVGARLALCLPNGAAFLDAFLGGLYAGCTLIPVPPMSAPPELAHRLQHGRCSGLITDARTRALGEQALQLAPGARSLDSAELLQGRADEQAGPVDLPAGANAMLLYTSGTTGVAKGAMITHASLATHTAALVHHVLRFDQRDCVLAVLPLTHSYGIRMTLLAPFYAGARSLLVERFESSLVNQLLGSEPITWFPGVPTMFHALVHHAADARAAQAPALRWCLSAGAPLAPEIRRRFETSYGVPLRQGFGLTEATFSSVADPADTAGADSVGKPVFGVEVRIGDEQGAPLPHGTRGEIMVRGQNVMAGYFDDPQASEAALSGGWLRTGDVGVLDAEGRLSVVDRIKDMIVRGGFNVYPAEVEAVLLSHPDVRQVVVVGIADEHYGEEVVAAVVPQPGGSMSASALASFCRLHLSTTKLPRLWTQLDAIPEGPSGKLLRRAVKQMVQSGALTLERPQMGR
ncbi:MAG: AMP-binding protein [Myxococcales bacterium]